jgi:protein TonB
MPWFVHQKASGLRIRAWVRLLAIIALVSAHAAVLAAIGVGRSTPIAVDAIEIAIDTTSNAQPEGANSPPEPEPAPQQEPEQPPEPEPPPTAPEPEPRKEEPAPKPEPKATKPSDSELERLRERRAQAQQRAVAADQRRQLAAAEAAQAKASFGAIVAARIDAAKFYPAEARNNGIVGSVGVRFSIGADGRVTNAILTRSSGSTILDAAALQIFKSLQAPIPPGGAFSGAINIRYSLGRS